MSPVRDTEREKKVIEKEDAPTLPEEVIVQRLFSIETICNFSQINEYLEANLNRDLVKNIEVQEKEKISKSGQDMK